MMMMMMMIVGYIQRFAFEGKARNGHCLGAIGHEMEICALS